MSTNASKHALALEQAKGRTHAQNVEWLRGLNPDSAREIAEVSKSAWGREYIEQHAASRARPANAEAPVTKTAIAAAHKADLEAYVTKVASDRGVTFQHAAGDLGLAGDPELTRLQTLVRNAENAAGPLSASGEVAKYRAWEQAQRTRADAEIMKRATAEAEQMARMTPSEKELHKRAAALAETKKIRHGEAMAELMETNKEARDLYRRIDFERAKR